MGKDSSFFWIKFHNTDTNENIFRVLDQFEGTDGCDVVTREDSAGSEQKVVRAPESLLKYFEAARAKDSQDIFALDFFFSRYDEGPIIRIHFLSELQRSGSIKKMKEVLRKRIKK